MSELFREIEEDIRQERLQKLWKSFGKLMVGISVGIVLATAAYVVLQNHRQDMAKEHTAMFLQGLDRMKMEDYRGAIAQFDALTDEGKSSYYGLAMLRKAQSQQALGDKEAAKRSYQALAMQEDVFGAIAKMLMSSEGQPITVPQGRDYPLYHSLREWKAWQLMDEGKKDEAVEMFAALYRDEEVPYSLRGRMQEVLQHMAPQKLEKRAVAEPTKEPKEKRVKVTPNE